MIVKANLPRINEPNKSLVESLRELLLTGSTTVLVCSGCAPIYAKWEEVGPGHLFGGCCHECSKELGLREGRRFKRHIPSLATYAPGTSVR